MNKKIIEVILGLPKSLYFNLKYFGIKNGIKLPVLLSSKVKFLELKGKIELKKIKLGTIQIGFTSCGIFDYKYSRSILEINGLIKFGENISLGQGIKISIGKDGILEIGDNFRVTGESEFICYKKIKIGQNCIVSWDNLFLDTDFHKIKINNEIINKDKEIEIGKNVWIGSRCTFLKGAMINDNSIVGSNSLVNKWINSKNVIIGGNPAKVLKEGIEWEK